MLTCFVALTASAQQKATEKDLQGKWKMVSFTADDVSIDITAGKYTLSPEMSKNLTAEQKEEMDLSMQMGIEMLKEAYATFEGSAFSQVIGPQSQKGNLIMKNGSPFVSFTDNGELVELAAAIIDKKLHLTKTSAEENIHLIYVKQ